MEIPKKILYFCVQHCFKNHYPWWDHQEGGRQGQTMHPLKNKFHTALPQSAFTNLPTWSSDYWSQTICRIGDKGEEYSQLPKWQQLFQNMLRQKGFSKLLCYQMAELHSYIEWAELRKRGVGLCCFAQRDAKQELVRGLTCSRLIG